MAICSDWNGRPEPAKLWRWSAGAAARYDTTPSSLAGRVTVTVTSGFICTGGGKKTFPDIRDRRQIGISRIKLGGFSGLVHTPKDVMHANNTRICPSTSPRSEHAKYFNARSPHDTSVNPRSPHAKSAHAMSGELCPHPHCRRYEVILDRKEGHMVCDHCGTIAEWSVACDDAHEGSTRSSAHFNDAPTDVRGRTPMDAQGTVRRKVESFASHHEMGAAVSEVSKEIIGLLPAELLRFRDLATATVLLLACEHSGSCFNVEDICRFYKVDRKKVLSFKDRLTTMPCLRAFLAPAAVPTVTSVEETMTFATNLIHSVLDPSRHKEARAYVLRRGREEEAAGNAAFMNSRPASRAAALVVQFFQSSRTDMSQEVKDALNVGSSAVKNTLGKLLKRKFKAPSGQRSKKRQRTQEAGSFNVNVNVNVSLNVNLHVVHSDARSR